MKKSIRDSLFLLFAALMIVLLLVNVGMNGFLLEKYYLYQTKFTFGDLTAEIQSNIDTGNQVEQKLDEIDRENGVSIIVADKNYQILFKSAPPKVNENKRLPKEIETLIEKTGNISSNPAYEVVQAASQQPKLAYVAKTSDEGYIVITRSMKEITDSVGISNQFYIMAGLLTLLLGSGLIYKFSNKVTRPIIEMSQIAKEISNLNFEKTITVNRDDEIGALANSINTLSVKLKASIEELKTDVEFQKNLMRNMFHELKTPIGVIKGYGEGLTFGVADHPEMRQKYLKVIVDECDRMDHLVMEMLELSKLEAKDYALQNQVHFELCSLIRSISERFQPILEEEQFHFEKECNQEIRIFGNYELLERAISNLVSNGIRYNNEDKFIRIKAMEEGQKVKICVYNTGEGIPENEIPKIFDVFYKIDKARTRENGGHGLGLAIVKSIVDLHQGEISAENQPRGVAFIITLPKKEL
jgi:signal transduction histidine kinase